MNEEREHCRTPVLGPGLEFDFVFPPSRQLTTTRNNPHQNLPEGSVLRTWYLALRLNSLFKDQVTTVMDGHPPFQDGLPPYHPEDGYPSAKIWSHTFLRILTQL